MKRNALPRMDLPVFAKRILPRTLFGRALLILVLPTVLVQLIATYIFYDRHWENVSRWMASSLAGEIALLVHEFNEAPPERRQKLSSFAASLMAMRVELASKDESEKFRRGGMEVAPLFYRELELRLNAPFMLSLSPDGEDLLLRIKLPDAVMVVQVTRKRIVSGTTSIFIMWMFGTAAVLLGIAVIFLRNQIRPITKLSHAMEEFGRGHENVLFRPQGAQEVRKAGRAFTSMKQRLERQITARMEMLAGISHDLRTPLTRMRLGIEMLKDRKEAEPLREDVQEMEHMIAEYLDFARGEGQEKPQRQELTAFVQDIASAYQRQGHHVPVTPARKEVTVEVRPHVFRRALDNLIGNALRYGEKCQITINLRRQTVEIWVEDAGPGIPLEHHEEVFRPFRRLDASRNTQTGGVGLGMTIARDIIQGHGGDILLQDSQTLGGLKVVVRLPKADS